MNNRAKWKKLVQTTDIVSYIKDLGEYKAIIEARRLSGGWEIVKKYLGSGLNFVETYNARTHSELRRLLKTLRSEKDLSQNEINSIHRFRQKNLKVLVKRSYKTREVEKWYFSINDDYSNFITVYYGNEIVIDIIMEGQLKYIEEQIVDKLYDVLGLHDEECPITQHIYYFSKKTSQYIDTDSSYDLQFVIE